MSNKLTGILTSINITKPYTPKGPGGPGSWGNADIVFDNTPMQVGISPTLPSMPPVGGQIILTGKKDGSGYYIASQKVYTPGAGGYASSSNGTTAAASNGAGNGSRNNYWSNKEKYEQETRDPDIKLQSYYNIVSDITTTAMANGLPLKDGIQPTSVVQVLAFVRDQANYLAKGGCYVGERPSMATETPQVVNTATAQPVQQAPAPVEAAQPATTAAFDYASLG